MKGITRTEKGIPSPQQKVDPLPNDRLPDLGESHGLLPPARFIDVLRGRAPLIGSRLDPAAARGWLSPVEARVHLGIVYGNLLEAETQYLNRRTLRADTSVLVRTLVARMFARPTRAEVNRRPKIVSVRVDNLSLAEAMAAILAPPVGAKARMVFFVNSHSLNLAAFQPEYAAKLAEADLLLPDGIGIRVAGLILGTPVRHNLNGTDLLPLLCGEAEKEKLPLVFIGGSPGVADECAVRLRQNTPGLEIPIISRGYLTETESEHVARAICALGRCIVLVGMGNPVQETWSLRHLRDAAGVTVITVGGLFDFYSGRIPRAPHAWRESGVEWLWRLRMEPRRLAKRYLFGNPLFICLVLWQRLTHRT